MTVSARACVVVSRCREGERGTALVEFTIVMLAFFMLTFGIIDFGRALFTYHTVADAARFGARYAIVHGSYCSLATCPADQTAIQTYVRSVSPGVPVQIAVNWPDPTTCNRYGTDNEGPGCRVQVTASYPFQFLVPIVANFTWNMTSTSTMVISQ